MEVDNASLLGGGLQHLVGLRHKVGCMLRVPTYPPTSALMTLIVVFFQPSFLLTVQRSLCPGALVRDDAACMSRLFTLLSE
jgi:hypothetical protein